jgi:Fic family protein
MSDAVGVPPLGFEDQRWDWQGQRPIGRADRMFSTYRSSVPPQIAEIDVRLDRQTQTAINGAVAAIATLERDQNVHYAGIAGALLRSESVGSSKIERLHVDARTLGLAAIGESRRTSDAAQVWANVGAMVIAIDAASDGPISVGTFHRIHATLMRDDPHEKAWAGRFREMQNWIGGSDACPRGALHVPPAPGRVPALMDDLAGWCTRVDIDPVTRAAVAHAQFETIHPYTDGNGRTGRAIIHTILRQGRVVTASIVPTSAALMTDVKGYFDSLDRYRAGDVGAYLVHFAEATVRATSEALRLGTELKAIATEWHDRTRLRVGSVAAAIVSGLIQQPVITATLNAAMPLAPQPSTIYRAIEVLVDGGVLTEITDGKRNRVWAALEITAALDDFTRRLGPRQPGW